MSLPVSMVVENRGVYHDNNMGCIVISPEWESGCINLIFFLFILGCCITWTHFHSTHLMFVFHYSQPCRINMNDINTPLEQLPLSQSLSCVCYRSASLSRTKMVLCVQSVAVSTETYSWTSVEGRVSIMMHNYVTLIKYCPSFSRKVWHGLVVRCCLMPSMM